MLDNINVVNVVVQAGNILVDSNGAVKLGDFGVSACMFDTGDRQRERGGRADPQAGGGMPHARYAGNSICKQAGPRWQVPLRPDGRDRERAEAEPAPAELAHKYGQGI